MPTYSSRLRITQQANGENSNTWGTVQNSNHTLIEEAIAGYALVNVAGGDVVLTTVNGGTDQARKAVIVAQGSPGVPRIITVPNVSKVYHVINQTNQVLTVKNSSTATYAVPASTSMILTTDGAAFMQPMAAGYSTVSGTVTATSLTVSGVSTLGTTPTGTTPLTVTASTGAFAMSIKGRASDNVGLISYLSNSGAAEYGRLQSNGTNGLTCAIGTAGAVTAWFTNSTGDMNFPHTVNNSNGRVVTYAAGSNPGFTCYDSTQAVAAGIFMGAGNRLYVGSMDSTGTYLGLSTSWRWFADVNGNVTSRGTTTSTSDRRLKTDFAPVVDPEASIKGLAAATSWYHWIGQEEDRLQLGFIAQDVEPVLPEAVHDGPDGSLSVADRPILAVVTAALDRALDRIAALEARVAALGA